MPPTVDHPALVQPNAATRAQAFRIAGQTSHLWFAPQSDTLIVSFDNLATLDHPLPRKPWIYNQVTALGYSILGVQSERKDWFRKTDAPDLLKSLADTGFFDSFEQIIFAGASMGGFAAINYAPLVPRARVLALSPQSTMNTVIAPFERRFTWAVRNSDWTDPIYLDAADAIPDVEHATIVYDPFVDEDKRHAERLIGPNVQMIPIAHSTHEAVRTVMKSGAFDAMLQEFVANGRLGHQFWRAMRGRRTSRKWARALVNNLQASQHTKLALRAYDALIAKENYLFAMQARRTLLEAHPELGDD